MALYGPTQPVDDEPRSQAGDDASDDDAEGIEDWEQLPARATPFKGSAGGPPTGAADSALPARHWGPPQPRSSSEWLKENIGRFSEAQQAYLGALIKRHREGFALRHSMSTVDDLALWRRWDEFKVAEKLTLALAWSMGPALSRYLLEAGSVPSALRLVHEVDNADHSRDRIHAAEVVLTGARVLPTAERLAPEEASTGKQLLLELKRRYRELKDAEGKTVETETTEEVTVSGAQASDEA